MLKKQTQIQTIEKNLAKNLKIAIVRSEYYDTLTRNLEKHCTETLIKHGVNQNNIKTFLAPGSWEIPLITQAVAKSQKFDAIVTFGVIVKGHTFHFELIAKGCTHTLMQLSLDYNLPIAFEILVVFDISQAEKRAADDKNNKGIEAANAILKALKTLKTI